MTETRTATPAVVTTAAMVTVHFEIWLLLVTIGVVTGRELARPAAVTIGVVTELANLVRGIVTTRK